MKRFLAAMFAIALLLTVLCACGNSTATEEKGEKDEESATGFISHNRKDAEDEEEKEDESAGQLEIVDSGYTVMEPDSDADIYLTYAVTIKNTHRKLAAQFPEISITGRKEDGSILFSEEETLNIILPGDTVSYADDFIDCRGEKPASVEIKVEGADFVKPDMAYADTVESSSFKIENLSVFADDYEVSVTGEITNNSDVDFDTVEVTVILKNQGKIVGGYSGYVDNLSAHKQTVFDLSSFWSASELPAHDSVEVVAQGC